MILRIVGLLAALVAAYFLLRASFDLIGPFPTIGIAFALAIVVQLATRKRA